MSYWDCGTFRLRHGVLELIAGLALLEVEGVRGVGMRSGYGGERPKRKNLSKGIKAQVEEGRITFTLQIYADYDSEFLPVARVVQERIKEVAERMTGMMVTAVDVEVVGVNAP